MISNRPSSQSLEMAGSSKSVADQPLVPGANGRIEVTGDGMTQLLKRLIGPASFHLSQKNPSVSKMINTAITISAKKLVFRGESSSEMYLPQCGHCCESSTMSPPQWGHLVSAGSRFQSASSSSGYSFSSMA